jgi:hypothetical protein
VGSAHLRRGVLHRWALLPPLHHAASGRCPTARCRRSALSILQQLWQRVTPALVRQLSQPGIQVA